MAGDTTALRGLRAPERLTLMDLAPKRAIVSLSSGQEIEVLSAADVLHLLKEHVALQKYLERIPLSFLEIAQTAPAAVPVAIAWGCGYRDDKEKEAEAIKVAANLSLQDQVDILRAIGGVTFTRGFGPFRGDDSGAGSGTGLQGVRGWKGAGYTIAENASALIAFAGQPEAWVWSLSPRQLAAHAFLMERNEIRRQVGALVAARTGAHATADAYSDYIQSLLQEI